MYCTYESPVGEPYVISHWDGDCYSYTVCETKEEYEAEEKRLDEIEEDYNRQKDAYMEALRKGLLPW